MVAEGRSREVVALLHGHSVPARAAPRIAETGEDLRQRTAQTGIEYAALFEWETGTQVGTVLEGAEDRIILNPQTALLRPGRRYVQLHTHPGSSSLSPFDLAILLSHPELRLMAVVGQDSSWDVLSKRQGHPSVDPAQAFMAWRGEYTEVSEQYDLLVAGGVLSPAEALRRELHETMERLAPGLGLRYDHLEVLR
jgi:hypothetical protein